jgi:hypothetical protein
MTPFVQRIRRNLAHSAAWGEIARDWTWRLGPAHTPEVAPAATFTPDELTGVRLLWPATYQWSEAEGWVGNLLLGFRRLVPIVRTDLPQPCSGVVLVRLVHDGGSHDVAIDYSDYPDRIDQEGLHRAACYFKMQFHPDGYGDDRIVPGGYINASKNLYHYLPRLRRSKDRQPPLYDVYGRFGLSFASEIRKKAVTLLREQTEFGFTGSTGIVRHGQSLREVARAKISIDMPSNSPFTFRLCDYLAIGACIVGPPHRARMHAPLVDREHLYYCAEDLSDLLDICRHLLADDAERARITRNAREYFDRYVHRDQLARYYLRTILDRTRAGAGV